MFDQVIGFFCNTLPRWYRWPYEMVYWKGPSLYGYGFWGGATSEDICMTYTGVPSKHWNQNGVAMCEEMKERYFTAFFIAIHTLFALGFFGYFIMRICCCRPIGNYIIRVISILRTPIICTTTTLSNQEHQQHQQCNHQILSSLPSTSNNNNNNNAEDVNWVVSDDET